MGVKSTSRHVLAVLLASTILAACDEVSETGNVDELMQRASERRAAGKIRASIIDLKTILQKSPKNADARLLLGQVYLDIGDGEAAEKEAGQALALGANARDVFEIQGNAWLLQNKHNVVLEKIAQGAGDNASMRALGALFRGEALQNLGRLDEASKEFETALAEYRKDINEERPHLKLTMPAESVKALVNLSKIAISQRSWPLAQERLEKAQSIAPKDTNVIATKGLLYFEKREFEFKQVIVKASDRGRLIRLQDVARVELGAKDYITNSYLNGKPAVALGIFQRPATNALETASDIIATMERLKQDFPPGLDFQIVYNPTEFIEESIFEVYKTLFEATFLVVVVIVIFLQSWRAAIIPIAAIPVSLIGTFAIMSAFGFSLNTLTLFGLILAIGIVVDDAIVVVENVERNLANGMSPRDATHRTIDEVAGALVATTLVLIAVFVPTAFIPGISGQFYQQFALTIAVSTVLSTVNSLTLSPALAALLLRPRDLHSPSFFLTRWLRGFSNGFNAGFDKLSGGYAATVGMVVRRKFVMLLLYAGLIGGTVYMFNTVPRGFIPTLDQGYAIVVVQLPDGASLARTDAVVERATKIIRDMPGIKDAVAFAGFSGATFTNASNAAAIFTTFKPDAERRAAGLSADRIIGQMFGRLQAIQEAFIIAIPPPPVRGVGSSGGFKMQLQERWGDESGRVLAAAYGMMGQARQTPGVIGVFTTFSGSSPQLYLEIDRVKARMLNVPIPAIFEALQMNLGTVYVNDFNAFGRVYQVRAQADQRFRLEREDISRLKVRAATGALVPLGTLVEIKDVAGPDLVQRYNMYTSVPIQGNAAPGVSTGEALDTMEKMAAQILPEGISFEWTELAFQEKQTGNAAIYIFALSIVFVFLVLAAQYESWVLPLAIILIVPLSMLSALFGVMMRGMDNNILTQIGLVVLVALAAKNAILIVEFAKQQEEEGKGLIEAVVEACRLRLRPIMMTAFSFILGVVPLVIATGAGAEMRQAIGTAVFAGMLGVTLFGLLLTPVFYVVLRARRARRKEAAVTHAES